MTLTTPTAGTSPGRSANLARTVEPSGVGGAFAEFGRLMADTGNRLEADRLSRAEARLQIDMTRDLGALRQEYEQVYDPDRLRTEFPARVKALRADYLDAQDENGAPRLDPKLRQRAELRFDALANQHGLAISRHGIAARQQQRDAQWVEYSHEVATQSARADAGTRETLLAQAVSKIDDDLAAGLITPMEAVEQKVALRGQVAETSAIYAVDSDPQGFLDRAAAGEFSDLDPEQVARLEVRAQKSIAANQANVAKEAERAAKQAEAEIDDQLSLISDLASKEHLTAGEAEFMSRPDVQARPGYAAAAAAVALRDDLPTLRQMTPAELRAEAEKSRMAPKSAKYQAERAAALEALASTLEKAWAADGVAQARSVGFDVPDIDVTSPDGLAQGLAGRMTLSRWLQAEGYTKGSAIFTADERAELRDAIAQTGDPAQRAALARAIAAGSGGVTGAILSEVDASPVFSYATGLAGAGGAPDLVQSMLRGEQKIALKTVNMPNAANQRLIFDEITGGMIEDDAGTKAQILAAAGAVYADMSGGVDPEEIKSGRWADGEARIVYEQAIQRALGAQQDRNGKYTIGGLQEVNGNRVLLPVGVARDEANEAVAAVGRQLRGGVRSGQMWDYSPNTADPLRALRAAGVGGAVPDLGGDPADRWDDLRIEAVGNDVYRLVYTGGLAPVPVPGQDGREYWFSLRRLIGGVGQ